LEIGGYYDDVDRRQLRCFVAVVDHGGFSRAADELGVAQPSLSQSIAALEKKIGVELFHRLGRGVRLTAAGEALLEPVRQILRDFTVAEDSVARVGALAGGTLDVAAIPTLVQPLAELVGVFRRDHPEVVVRAPEVSAVDGVESAVAAGVCELGLTELPCSAEDLRSIELGRQPFQLVLPPSSEVVDPFPLRRFDRLRFVATPTGTSSRSRLDEALAHTRAGAADVCVETGHRDALIALVLAGAGAAFLPEPMAADARKLGAAVASTTPVISRRYGIVHRPAPLSPAAQAFVGLAREGATP
jgi:DNA-binding transcriptional LysR family regulator